MSATLRLTPVGAPRITLVVFLLFIAASQCSTINDSPFSLTNKATGFCLVKKSGRCLDVRWTTGNRLFVIATKKCLGAQGKSVGSEVNYYDCDDKSDLQKWECRNETLLALKDQQLYIEIKDETLALSRTVGPNNHFTITGTSSGACTRTYRELFTIEGNAFGKICMFPFLYKDRWFGDCTTYDSSSKRSWCAVETKFEHEQWGYCPTSSTEHWTKNLATGAYYQLNTQSVLTWPQAETSCKQQAASLVSVIDPNEQAFISALLGSGRKKLWIGLVLNPEHGWQWTNRKPFRYLRWDAGNPIPDLGHNCALLDTAEQHAWQSSSCVKKLGYICYKDGAPPVPPQIEQGFCLDPWIPYNGHCFHLDRTLRTWSNAQLTCRKEGGDLVSIHNVEDQSFVISQLGYDSSDELWIGLNDKNTEGLFDWSDHSPVSFTSWEFGKPTVATDGEDCVLIRGENGNWADRSCDEKHGFICMKQSSTENTGHETNMAIGCKDGWKRHGSYCYFVGTETKTFDEAKDDCKSSGSYLADVSNGVDNAFLISLVGLRPEKHFWLGLSNRKNIDFFEWTNTDSVKFTHWNAQMPGYEQGCVAIRSGILAGLWDLLPCNNKEKYICKHLAEGAVSTVPPPTLTPLQCEEGWTRVGTSNMCTKVFTETRKTWFEARDYCRAIGGDLLSIHSASVQRLEQYSNKAWIGLHLPDPNSGFVWSDGTPVNFQKWWTGEPNNYNNEESCVEVMLFYSWDEAWSWSNVNCESYNHWLCEIRAGVTPKPPPTDTVVVEYNTTSDGWLEWRGNQYLIHTIQRSMEEARYFCQQRHGDLASISSKEENTFLWKQISQSYDNYYIGLSVDFDGSLWWMDGTPVSYERWTENELSFDDLNRNCVHMLYHTGFWSTCNCGTELSFICKRRSSAPANTTVAPTVPPTGGCSPTWTKFDSKCYKIFSKQKATWEEGQKQCINMGGTLVSIPSRRVQALLISKMADLPTTDLWIGLNALQKFEFFWSDGKPRQYVNWANFRPFYQHRTFHKLWQEEECVIMTSNPALGIGKWIIASCNDTNGFVCQRNLDPKIQTQSEIIAPNIYVQLVNDSIKVVTKNLTWDDAKKHCEGDKANLASLENAWTKAYAEVLAMNLKVPLWIGLNKQQTGGYFRYIDGWHLSSGSWAENEPSIDKPCVYVDVDGRWRTAFCNRTLYSVCMQSTDVPPTESSIFPGHCPEDINGEYEQSFTWLPFKGHCFLFVSDETDWPHAASRCIKHGGMLASIEDPSEQQFIKSNLEQFQDSNNAFWIGLYKNHKGTWLWLDKTVMDFTNWDQDELYSDYGLFRTSDGTWIASHSWYNPYICKTTKVISTASESKAEHHGVQAHHSRVHTNLVVVLMITVASTLTVVGFFFYKKSPRPFPAFENPLYFDTEQSQPDVVDPNKLTEHAENPEPILML